MNGVHDAGSSIFCCSDAIPDSWTSRSDDLSKLSDFTFWAQRQTATPEPLRRHPGLPPGEPRYAVELLHQVWMGPVQSTRYFAAMKDSAYYAIEESDLRKWNFEKLYYGTNRGMDLRCHVHNRFFEAHLWMKPPADAQELKAAHAANYDAGNFQSTLIGEGKLGGRG